MDRVNPFNPITTDKINPFDPVYLTGGSSSIPKTPVPKKESLAERTVKGVLKTVLPKKTEEYLWLSTPQEKSTPQKAISAAKTVASTAYDAAKYAQGTVSKLAPQVVPNFKISEDGKHIVDENLLKPTTTQQSAKVATLGMAKSALGTEGFLASNIKPVANLYSKLTTSPGGRILGTALKTPQGQQGLESVSKNSEHILNGMITGLDEKIQEETKKLPVSAQEGNIKQLFKDQEWLGYFLGTAAPSIAAAVGIGPEVAPFVLGTLDGGSAFNEAKAAGAGKAKQNSAFVVNAVISSLTEKVAFDRIFKAVPDSSKKGLYDSLKRVVESMLAEGTQEGFQQASSNVIAKWLYDNSRDIKEGVGLSFLIGGTAGGGMSLGVQAIGARPVGGLSLKDVSAKPVLQEGVSPAETAETIRQTAVKGLPPDIASTIEPLEKVLPFDKRTPINQRVNVVDYFRTPWRVFEKMGIRESYQKLLAGYEAYMKELPGNINKIKEWSKRVPKESSERIFSFLDGETIELTTEEAKVANEIKTWLSEWADRLGMSKDSRITDYITHIFPGGSIAGEIPEEIAYMISKKIPGTVYNPFLLKRLGAEGYSKDVWRALDAYTKRATRKVNMDPGLKAVKDASTKLTETTQLKYIENYISKVNMRPNYFDMLVDNFIKQHAGFSFGARPTAAITRSIRMMIARAKIGFSAVSFAKNLMQSVNTFADLGAHYTAVGYMNLVKFGEEELNENGVLIAPFIEDRAYSAVKGALEKADKVLFINMNASELVNRGAAYYGAKAKFLNGKITPKEYKLAFGKEMANDYTPTLEDAIDYGKFVAAKTQFKFGALDTPVAMNSDLVKMALQFQTFGVKQAEFVAQLVKDKEYAKLVRYTASSMLLFQLIGGAFGMGWKDSFKTLRFGPPPAYQFFKDLFDAIWTGEDKYGAKLNVGERATSVVGTLFSNVVPGGAQWKRGYQGLKAVSEGGSRTAGGKLQYKVNKTPSNYIRGTLFGKYNLPEAKTYYKEKYEKAKANAKKTKATTNPFDPQ